MGSESDVFVKAELLEHGSDTPIGTASWPVKWDLADPVWDSARLISVQPVKATALLRLHFYDHDDVGADDYIGTTEVMMRVLGMHSTETFPIEVHTSMEGSTKKGTPKPTCTVRREPASRYVGKKTIYIVRHGESVWNKAQDDKRFDVMLSDVDHPLNETGRAQAEGLRTALGGGGDEAAAILAAEAVMCSPLTRAVQTCLIGLQPLLLPAGGSPAVVRLNPNLREKRNTGGKDSSGKWVGDALAAGVHEELGKLLADEPERSAALREVPLELGHVQERWWLGSKESHEAVHERIAELLHQVHFCEQNTIVLVGHSHYFREMLRKFAAPSCELAAADGSALPREEMSSKKLSNAGVARCTLDFDAHPEAPVAAVQLLFATELVS